MAVHCCTMLPRSYSMRCLAERQAPRPISGTAAWLERVRMSQRMSHSMPNTPARFQKKPFSYHQAGLTPVACMPDKPASAGTPANERQEQGDQRNDKQRQIVIWSRDDDRRIMGDADVALLFPDGQWMPVHSAMLEVFSPVLSSMCDDLKPRRVQKELLHATFHTPIIDDGRLQKVLELTSALASTTVSTGSSAAISLDRLDLKEGACVDCSVSVSVGHLAVGAKHHDAVVPGGPSSILELGKLDNIDAPHAWRAFIRAAYETECDIAPGVTWDLSNVMAAYPIAHKYKAQRILDKLTAFLTKVPFNFDAASALYPEFGMNMYRFANKYTNAAVEEAVLKSAHQIARLVPHSKNDLWSEQKWIETLAEDPAIAPGVLRLLCPRR